MKTVQPQRGFTLVELMVTIAVAAIVTVVAVPALRDYVANARLTTTTNDFVTAIAYARSEAVKRGARINIQAVAPGDNTNEWGGGWNVVDLGGNVIRRFTTPGAGVVTLDGTDGVITIGFDDRGLLIGVPAAITIDVCDDRVDETGRQLTIEVTGRPQLDRQFGGCA